MDRLGFLMIWNGCLTVALVVMATVVITANYRSSPPQEELATERSSQTQSTEKEPHMSPADLTTSNGSSPAFVQLIASGRTLWIPDSDLSPDLACVSCSLLFRNNAIHCNKEGLFQLFALVTFEKTSRQNRSVIFRKNQRLGSPIARKFVEVSVSESQDIVFLMKIVSLQKEDSVSIEIKGDFKVHNDRTYWGMKQL